MSKANADYQLRVLKKYGFLPHFDEELIRENVPSPVDGETFNSWCERVLNRKPAEVLVWKLEPIPGQTRIQTLGRKSADEALRAVIKAEHERGVAHGIAIAHKKDNPDEFDLVVAPVERDDLRKVAERVSVNRSPAVVDFFKHFIDEQNEDTEWETAFEDLARRHAELIESSRAAVEAAGNKGY